MKPPRGFQEVLAHQVRVELFFEEKGVVEGGVAGDAGQRVPDPPLQQLRGERIVLFGREVRELHGEHCLEELLMSRRRSCPSCAAR